MLFNFNDLVNFLHILVLFKLIRIPAQKYRNNIKSVDILKNKSRVYAARSDVSSSMNKTVAQTATFVDGDVYSLHRLAAALADEKGKKLSSHTDKHQQKKNILKNDSLFFLITYINTY